MWSLPGRLQRKVHLIISAIVVVPMLVAGWLASEWVSSRFEARLQVWIVDAARANQNWLQAYQTDASMLGRVLADDPAYVPGIMLYPDISMPTPVAEIAKELGLNFIQVYTPDKRPLYSSTRLRLQTTWEAGQTEAVLKVGGARRGKSMLVAVGITPVPRKGKPEYYLLVGSLIGKGFANELAQLTGLTTRIYYRDGRRFYDLYSNPARPQLLSGLPADAMRRLERAHKPYYSVYAEGGEYRGVYTPIVDSTGRVEAIMFGGLERRTLQDLLTNRVALFFCIALLGIVIGVLTGIVIGRLVLRPIAHLRNGVIQVAGRNYDARVPIDSNDELGDLAKAFNAMAAQLRAARDEEQQRFQRDKLAAMGELSAALAHEIRNPIGVINTSAAMLDKPGLDPDKKAALTRMLREESLRVAALVQDFLHLSRHRRPALDLIDPVVPLERALEANLAGHDAIVVHKDFCHEDTVINGDCTLLQQAWGNIVANAVQAMGGARRGELRVTSRRDNGEVAVSIEDSGPGIAVDVMPRLFEPFFTTKEHGSGLGLTIAYNLIEANGGRLEAFAGAHGGARFVMRFPARNALKTIAPGGDLA